MEWKAPLTIFNMATISQPAAKGDGRDLQPGLAEEAVLHLGKTFGRSHSAVFEFEA